MKVLDELDGINFVYQIYKSKDVHIYHIDLNSSLKRERPAWSSERRGKKLIQEKLDWIKEVDGEYKHTSIDFGTKYKDFDISVSVSRYTCIVTFYRKNLRESRIAAKTLYSS